MSEECTSPHSDTLLSSAGSSSSEADEYLSDSDPEFSDQESNSNAARSKQKTDLLLEDEYLDTPTPPSSPSMFDLIRTPTKPKSKPPPAIIQQRNDTLSKLHAKIKSVLAQQPILNSTTEEFNKIVSTQPTPQRVPSLFSRSIDSPFNKVSSPTSSQDSKPSCPPKPIRMTGLQALESYHKRCHSSMALDTQPKKKSRVLIDSDDEVPQSPVKKPKPKRSFAKVLDKLDAPQATPPSKR
ncbi:hypothetical protein GEMRC1_004664 [Eukaryota sp. GEM-RC1]